MKEQFIKNEIEKVKIEAARLGFTFNTHIDNFEFGDFNLWVDGIYIWFNEAGINELFALPSEDNIDKACELEMDYIITGYNLENVVNNAKNFHLQIEKEIKRILKKQGVKYVSQK